MIIVTIGLDAMHSTEVICSPQNPFYRQCLQLRDNRKRRRSGLFLVDGENEIRRAWQAGYELDRILVPEGLFESELLRELMDAGVEIQRLAIPLFEKIRFGEMNCNLVALAAARPLPLESIQLDSNSFVLVLDRTEKPGNLGACIRTAAGCGVSAVVLTNPICDPFNPNAIRASRGTVFSVPLAICSTEQFIAKSRELSLPIFRAVVEASRCLWEVDLSKGAVVVFGNESQGLGADWRQESTQDFTIPMSDMADSLNLSISAAVTLYEAKRQRTAAKI